jgi:hypothetical protein
VLQVLWQSSGRLFFNFFHEIILLLSLSLSLPDGCSVY